MFRSAYDRGNLPFDGAGEAKVILCRNREVAGEIEFFIGADLLPRERVGIKTTGDIGAERHLVIVSWKGCPPTKDRFHQWCDFAYGYRKAAGMAAVAGS